MSFSVFRAYFIWTHALLVPLLVLNFFFVFFYVGSASTSGQSLVIWLYIIWYQKVSFWNSISSLYLSLLISLFIYFYMFSLFFHTNLCIWVVLKLSLQEMHHVTWYLIWAWICRYTYSNSSLYLQPRWSPFFQILQNK